MFQLCAPLGAVRAKVALDVATVVFLGPVIGEAHRAAVGLVAKDEGAAAGAALLLGCLCLILCHWYLLARKVIEKLACFPDSKHNIKSGYLALVFFVVVGQDIEFIDIGKDKRGLAIVGELAALEGVPGSFQVR